jgi:hypothetical protein
MKTICTECKKILNQKEICCGECAEDTLHDLLKGMRKKPDKIFIKHFQSLILTHQGKNIYKKAQEAFSFSEAIDKFVIIALKNKYLTGDRLIQNKEDYDAMEKIMIGEFQRHKVGDVKKMFGLLVELWEVNAEIFCVNDICSQQDDDSVVAASARRMIFMIKERNRIKHEIAHLLHETMYETKQFK